MIFDTHKLALSEATLGTVATKSDIAEVKAQIAELKASLIPWIVGALAFNFVAVTGLVITIIKVFGR